MKINNFVRYQDQLWKFWIFNYGNLKIDFYAINCAPITKWKSDLLIMLSRSNFCIFKFYIRWRNFADTGFSWLNFLCYLRSDKTLRVMSFEPMLIIFGLFLVVKSWRSVYFGLVMFDTNTLSSKIRLLCMFYSRGNF